MSKQHNYSQYSNKNKKNETEPEIQVEQVVEPEVAVPETPSAEVKMEVTETVIQEPTVEETTTEVPEIPVVGTVVGCTKLNVRAYPASDAEIVCIIDATAPVEVVPAKTTIDWAGVVTEAGIEGYCMRKFIDVAL